jgi:hypothetical protein
MDTPDTPPVKRWSLIKAAIGGLIGVVPGFVCWYCGWVPANGSIVYPILIGAGGAFVGVLLTRPDVSARRVLKGTAVLMVAKAAPGPLRESLYDELFREEGPPQSPQDKRTDDQAAMTPTLDPKSKEQA